MKKLEDEADIGTRRQHYLERIEAAFEAAAKASDPETIAGWKQVAEGYRLLLSRLPFSPLPDQERRENGGLSD